MDPITAVGAVASIVTLAQTALSLSQTLYTLGSAVASASEDVQILADDLKTFAQSLTLLSRLLEDSKSWYSDDVYLLTAKIIRDCADLYVKIDKILVKLGGSGKSNWKLRVKFVYKEGQIRKLMKRLRDMKGTLATILMSLQVDLQLSLLNISSSSKIQRQREKPLHETTIENLKSAHQAVQACDFFSKHAVRSKDSAQHVQTTSQHLQDSISEEFSSTQSFVLLQNNSQEPLSPARVRCTAVTGSVFASLNPKHNGEESFVSDRALDPADSKWETATARSIKSASSVESFKSAMSAQETDNWVEADRAMKSVQSVLHAFRTALNILDNLIHRRMHQRSGGPYASAIALRKSLVFGDQFIDKILRSLFLDNASRSPAFKESNTKALASSTDLLLRNIVTKLHMLSAEHEDLQIQDFNSMERLSENCRRDVGRELVEVLHRDRVLDTRRPHTPLAVTHEVLVGTPKIEAPEMSLPFIGYTFKRFDNNYDKLGPGGEPPLGAMCPPIMSSSCSSTNQRQQEQALCEQMRKQQQVPLARYQQAQAQAQGRIYAQAQQAQVPQSMATMGQTGVQAQADRMAQHGFSHIQHQMQAAPLPCQQRVAMTVDNNKIILKAPHNQRQQQQQHMARARMTAQDIEEIARQQRSLSKCAAQQATMPQQVGVRRHPASSDADCSEAKAARAVEKADSSDSDETFVYESNAPDAVNRPRRYHSRTPSAVSMASQTDQRNGLRSAREGDHRVAMKKSMKFEHSPANENAQASMTAMPMVTDSSLPNSRYAPAPVAAMSFSYKSPPYTTYPQCAMMQDPQEQDHSNLTHRYPSPPPPFDATGQRVPPVQQAQSMRVARPINLPQHLWAAQQQSPIARMLRPRSINQAMISQTVDSGYSSGRTVSNQAEYAPYSTNATQQPSHPSQYSTDCSEPTGPPLPDENNDNEHGQSVTQSPGMEDNFAAVRDSYRPQSPSYSPVESPHISYVSSPPRKRMWRAQSDPFEPGNRPGLCLSDTDPVTMPANFTGNPGDNDIFQNFDFDSFLSQDSPQPHEARLMESHKRTHTNSHAELQHQQPHSPQLYSRTRPELSDRQPSPKLLPNQYTLPMHYDEKIMSNSFDRETLPNRDYVLNLTDSENDKAPGWQNSVCQPDQDEDPYRIKCICDHPDDDGNTIYCEACDTWQHIECFYPDQIADALDTDNHFCADCKPRPLDKQRAIERQELHRQALTNDDSGNRRTKQSPSKSHKKAKPSQRQESTLHDSHNTGTSDTENSAKYHMNILENMNCRVRNGKPLPFNQGVVPTFEDLIVGWAGPSPGPTEIQIPSPFSPELESSGTQGDTSRPWLPVPMDPAISDDPPLFVNPKQFERIVKRRRARQKQEGSRKRCKRESSQDISDEDDVSMEEPVLDSRVIPLAFGSESTSDTSKSVVDDTKTHQSSSSRIWLQAYENLQASYSSIFMVLAEEFGVFGVQDATICTRLSKLVSLIPKTDHGKISGIENIFAMRENVSHIVTMVDQQMGLETATIGWCCIWAYMKMYDRIFARHAISPFPEFITLKIEASFLQLLDVTGIIARYAVMENLYRQSGGSLSLKDDYQASLISLCESMIAFLAEIYDQGCRFENGNYSSILLRSDKLMDEIRRKDESCRAFKVVVDIKESDTDSQISAEEEGGDLSDGSWEEVDAREIMSW